MVWDRNPTQGRSDGRVLCSLPFDGHGNSMHVVCVCVNNASMRINSNSSTANSKTANSSTCLKHKHTPANKELLDGPAVVLGHQQDSGVELLGTAAQQRTNGVVVDTPTYHLHLVGDL